MKEEEKSKTNGFDRWQKIKCSDGLGSRLFDKLISKLDEFIPF